MTAWVLVLGGVALLALLAHDVVSTTLAVGAAAGPLTSRIGRGWWRVARRLSSGPRSPLVTWAGPTVLILTVSVWMALLWGGWILIFSSSPDAVVSAESGEPADGWSRVYYAAFTVFTLGVGDYVPQGPAWQVATSVAVASGLALVTMGITYLMPVVNAVTSRRTQASSISGLGDDAVGIVVGGWHDGSFDELVKALPQLASEVLNTAERHLSYPVVHFFHSAERHVDLRVKVAELDEAVSVLMHGVGDDVAPAPQDLRRLRHAVKELVDRADVPAAEEPPEPPDLQRVRDAGIPTVDDVTFERRLADEREHRRRLAGYASESLWWQHVAD